jgi:hypothetical protein
MKKFLKSRWFVALLGGILFIATLVGLTLKSKDMLLQAALESSGATQRAEKEQAVEKAKESEKPETIENVAETPESIAHKQDKPEQDRSFTRHFANLDRATAAGNFPITDPSLGELIQGLRVREKRLIKRETELEELNSHVNEQLKELQFHTNNIAMNRAHLEKLLEGKVEEIRKNETNKLVRLAVIYQDIMNTGDALNREDNLRSLLRASQIDEPTLNAMVFQFMDPTNQASLARTLLGGDAEDVELYNNIINEWRRIMVNPDPSPSTTP